MTQYLLSVHMVEGAEVPSPEDVAQMYKDVDVVNTPTCSAVWAAEPRRWRPTAPPCG